MSTTASPQSDPAVPPPTFAPPAPRRSAGRRVAIALGALAAAAGAVLALAGGALFAVFGSDGAVSTAHHGLATPTSALVSETASIDDTADVSDVIGNTRVKVDARADGRGPVFVGIGRAADVERYLAGASTDEVTDFDVTPYRVDRERHAGTATPAPPAAQDFWVAQGSGNRAAVNWKVRDGDYRVVVMNADASRGVHTRTAVGVDVPFLPGLGIGILAGGLLVAAGGIAAIAYGARRPR